MLVACDPTVSLQRSASSPSYFAELPELAEPKITPSPSSVLVLHWESLQLHAEPRYRLLFEGGDPGGFSELRLRGADEAVVAAGTPVSSATEVIRMCGGIHGPMKTGLPWAAYGALRVTLVLRSQEQLSDVIRYPERYRVDVLVGGEWQPARLIHECDGQE
jgi:hypothetical protein